MAPFLEYFHNSRINSVCFKKLWKRNQEQQVGSSNDISLKGELLQFKINMINISLTQNLLLHKSRMLSSLKLTSKTIIGKDQAKGCKHILQALINSNDSASFQAPVDWKGLGLLDYGYLIKNPMDLGTVTQKFNTERYMYVEEVLDDIQLIWDNCKSYNPQSTWIYNIAQKLERSFKKMVKNYLPNISIIVPGRNSIPLKDGKKLSQTNISQNDYNDEIPYNEKLKFSEKLKILTPEELGTVVQAIMEKCPSAFKETGDDNAQLLVDNIDTKTLRQVNSLVESLSASYQDKVIKRLKLQ